MVMMPPIDAMKPRMMPPDPSAAFMSPRYLRSVRLHAVGVGLLVLLRMLHEDPRADEERAVLGPFAFKDNRHAGLEQFRRVAGDVMDLDGVGGRRRLVDRELDAEVDLVADAGDVVLHRALHSKLLGPER